MVDFYWLSPFFSKCSQFIAIILFGVINIFSVCIFGPYSYQRTEAVAIYGAPLFKYFTFDYTGGRAKRRWKGAWALENNPIVLGRGFWKIATCPLVQHMGRRHPSPAIHPHACVVFGCHLGQAPMGSRLFGDGGGGRCGLKVTGCGRCSPWPMTSWQLT